MSAKPVWGWHPRRSFGSYKKKWKRNQWDETRQQRDKNRKTKRVERLECTKEVGNNDYDSSITGPYDIRILKLICLVCFTLLRNPFSTLAALTDNDLGILICFSKMTANEEEKKMNGIYWESLKFFFETRMLVVTYLGKDNLLCFGQGYQSCRLYQRVTSQPSSQTSGRPVPTSPH